MSETNPEQQAYLNSLKNCVEKREHLFSDQDWFGHLCEVTATLGNEVEVNRVTDLMFEAHGYPSNDQELGLGALYMFVKFHLLDTGVVDFGPADRLKPRIN